MRAMSNPDSFLDSSDTFPMCALNGLTRRTACLRKANLVWVPRPRPWMSRAISISTARFVADAEAIYSYEGTREINALVVGRAITGFGAFV